MVHYKVRLYLEDAQVGLELADEGSALVRVVLWLHLDRPVKALQPLPRDACARSSSLAKRRSGWLLASMHALAEIFPW